MMFHFLYQDRTIQMRKKNQQGTMQRVRPTVINILDLTKMIGGYY